MFEEFGIAGKVSRTTRILLYPFVYIARLLSSMRDDEQANWPVNEL